MFNRINISFTASVLIILSAVFMRLVPHPPNFAPIGALALFSGAYLPGRKKIIIPFAAMLMSDLVLGLHTTIPFVYGSFFITIILGAFLQKNQSFYRIGTFSLLSSVLFFIITNFGVWATGSMYAKTLPGLVNAYIMGIPFFKNTILGDLIYVFIFFYAFRLIESAGCRLARVIDTPERS